MSSTIKEIFKKNQAWLYFLYSGWFIFNFSQWFFVVRDHSRPKLHPTFGPCPWWFIFQKNLFYQKQCKYAMNTVLAEIKTAWTLPLISKINPGSGCFLLITAACIVFWKKSQNNIISPTFVLQVIYFTTSIKIKVLVELSKNEFPCKMSFPAKLNAQFLLKIPHPLFFANFWRPYRPSKKGRIFLLWKVFLEYLPFLNVNFSRTHSLPQCYVGEMKLLLDILMHIMTIIVLCYWPHAGFGENFNKFSCSKSPWITKKRIMQKNIPLTTITPSSKPSKIWSK